MQKKLDKAFFEFKLLIQQEEYFKAHEVLEEIWHYMRKSLHHDRNIIRGFINAAVALELKKRGRNNYLKVWETYEKYKPKNKYNDVVIFLDNYKKELQ